MWRWQPHPFYIAPHTRRGIPREPIHAGGADPWGAEVAKPQAETAPPAAKPPRKPAAAKPDEGKGHLNLSGDRSATMARMELDGDVSVQVFTLPNPYRVIVDLTGTTVLSPPKPGSGFGLVERYHSGRFEAGKSRIVMETLGPVKATAFPISPGPNGTKVLEIALTPMPVNEFGQGTGAVASQHPPPPNRRPQPTAAAFRPAASRPISGPVCPERRRLPHPPGRSS